MTENAEPTNSEGLTFEEYRRTPLALENADYERQAPERARERKLRAKAILKQLDLKPTAGQRRVPGAQLLELFWILLESLRWSEESLPSQVESEVGEALERALRYGVLGPALGRGPKGPKWFASEIDEAAILVQMYNEYARARRSGEPYYCALETVAEAMTEIGPPMSAKTVRARLSDIRSLMTPEERRAFVPDVAVWSRWLKRCSDIRRKAVRGPRRRRTRAVKRKRS